MLAYGMWCVGCITGTHCKCVVCVPHTRPHSWPKHARGTLASMLQRPGSINNVTYIIQQQRTSSCSCPRLLTVPAEVGAGPSTPELRCCCCTPNHTHATCPPIRQPTPACPPRYLRHLNIAYGRKYGDTLVRCVGKEMGGWLEKAMTAMLVEHDEWVVPPRVEQGCPRCVGAGSTHPALARAHAGAAQGATGACPRPDGRGCEQGGDGMLSAMTHL